MVRWAAYTNNGCLYTIATDENSLHSALVISSRCRQRNFRGYGFMRTTPTTKHLNLWRRGVGNALPAIILDDERERGLMSPGVFGTYRNWRLPLIPR